MSEHEGKNFTRDILKIGVLTIGDNLLDLLTMCISNEEAAHKMVDSFMRDLHRNIHMFYSDEHSFTRDLHNDETASEEEHTDGQDSPGTHDRDGPEADAG